MRSFSPPVSARSRGSNGSLFRFASVFRFVSGFRLVSGFRFVSVFSFATVFRYCSVSRFGFRGSIALDRVHPTIGLKGERGNDVFDLRRREADLEASRPRAGHVNVLRFVYIQIEFILVPSRSNYFPLRCID